MTTADESMKLLDNGYRVVLFKDGTGSYTAVAVAKGDGLQAAVRRWQNHDEPVDLPPEKWPFDGPNKFAGCGFTPSEALHALTEKVLFNRLPGIPDDASGND